MRPTSIPLISLAGIIFLASVVAIYTSIPQHECIATWENQKLESVDGPIGGCPNLEHKRQVGQWEYVEVKGRVFRVTEEHKNDNNNGCMTGVVCVPTFSRPAISRYLKLIELPGPVDFAHLQAYFIGYLGDGRAAFHYWNRIIPLKPPLTLAALKSVSYTDYVTDGTWALFEEQVLPGADPATFGQVHQLTITDGAAKNLEWFGFGGDRIHVYYHAHILPGADPATFRAVMYHRDGAAILDEGAPLHGYIGLDKSHLWAADFDEVRAVPVSPAQLRQLWSEVRAAEQAQRLREP